MRRDIYTEHYLRLSGETKRNIWYTAPVLVDSRGIRYADGIFERYHNSYGKRDELITCSVGNDNGVYVVFNY